MKPLLNIVFISAASLFIFAPAWGLGGVIEAVTLATALLVGCLSMAGGLKQAQRTLQRIEADAHPPA